MQKEKIKQVIDAFPEEVDMDALMEKLFLLDKIEQGEKQIAEGKSVSHAEVKERLQTWLK
jgi:predicted transcriptional regulator